MPVPNSARYTGGEIFRGVVSGRTEVFVIGSAICGITADAAQGAVRLFSPTSREPIFVPGSSRSPTSTWCSHDAASPNTRASWLPRKAQEPSDAEAGGLAIWEGVGRKKAGAYKWYEIQDTIDYWREFDVPKIVWPNK